MRVLGRDRGDGPTAAIGRYRAVDGSEGASVGLDLDRPHVVLVVGKRGYGKSYTLGVLAEELACARGTTPVLADPMGVFRSLGTSETVPATPVEPAVSADDLGPRAWCDLLGLDPAGPAGSLVWRAAAESATIADLRAAVTDIDAEPAARRAAMNHIEHAAAWGIFDSAGLSTVFADGGCATIDLAGLHPGAMNAVVAGLAGRSYDARVADRLARLPWLVLDEAHTFFDGIAAPALHRVLTRGRNPGISLVVATQRPSALPDVAISQADILLVHRLTSMADREALAAARPAYMDQDLAARMPTDVGEALVIDDATETIHTIRIRERTTPHNGATPRASAVETRL